VLTIDYYSDILCVWAWVAQRRIEELITALGEQLKVQFHYVDVFGNIPHKMETQWASKGGYSGFAAHVISAVDAYDELEISPDVWSKVKPVTSANAHLVIKAVELAYDPKESAKMALTFRRAFFIGAEDIGNLDTLFSLAREQGLSETAIQQRIITGDAIAKLVHDYNQAKMQNIKGSPSYVMDGGRQTLYGNVGYRVLRANAEELLKQPANEASWC